MGSTLSTPSSSSLQLSLNDMSCRICHESLTPTPSEHATKAITIVLAHAPTPPQGTSEVCALRLPTIPEEAQPQEYGISNDVMHRQHLFHKLCYAKHIAHNARALSGHQNNWSARCPLCQKKVNLSDIKPINARGEHPGWLKSYHFYTQFQQLVSDLKRTQQPNITRDNFEQRATRHLAFTFSQHPYPYTRGRLLPMGHNDTSTYHHTPRTPDSEAQDQAKAGTMLAGVGLWVGIMRGPIGASLLLTGVGTLLLGIGMTRQLGQRRHQHQENSQLQEDNQQPTEQTPLI